MGLKPRLIQRGKHSESPGPFDLGDRIACVEHHPSKGAFQKVYHITEMDAEEVDRMALWLCHNCTQNFIFIESTTKILAGGSTNPLLAYQRRHMDRHTHMVDGYQIKLHEEDITFFELAWLNSSSDL